MKLLRWLIAPLYNIDKLRVRQYILRTKETDTMQICIHCGTAFMDTVRMGRELVQEDKRVARIIADRDREWREMLERWAKDFGIPVFPEFAISARKSLGIDI